MEIISSGINLQIYRDVIFIAKRSSILAKWFFAVICMKFVSDSQEQCLFLNTLQLFARCIYIWQVGRTTKAIYIYSWL